MTDPVPFRAGLFTTAYDAPPTRVLADGTEQWVSRGANFVVVMSRVSSGSRLDRTQENQTDEYVVLLPVGLSATVSAGAETATTDGDSVLIVPPGTSAVTAHAAGWVYQVFSALSDDLCQIAQHQAIYGKGTPDVRGLETWPAPVGGYKLRHYPLAQYVRPDKNPMRLFRTRHLMVNVFVPSPVPRDPRAMTPHFHDDFEQGSLALAGDWVHHLRYPWGPDMTAWRDDGHVSIGSPSLTIMTPNAIHTSQSIGKGPFQLVDIFAPPRDDFSLKSGLVCNADEYPLPDRLIDTSKPAQGA